MGNRYLDTEIFDRAATFAIKAHSNTERRGKGFPYIIHPMEAAAIVATVTTDSELLAAAILHDVVEDTDVSIEEIRAEFGERIAALVCAETDNLEGRPWRERKQAAVDRIAASSPDSKTVAIGDKLSNLRAIAADYRAIGDALWSRFHCGNREDVGWYYRSLAGALSSLSGTDAYKEYRSLLDEVFGPEEKEQTL